MEITDLPTLYQIAVAQESNSMHIESLHAMFEKQQIQIDNLKTLIDAQQGLIDDLIKYVQQSKRKC